MTLKMTQEEFNEMLRTAIDEGVLSILEEESSIKNWYNPTDYVIVHN